MRQRRWLELLKDYYVMISYYQEKANRATNAQSIKAYGTLVAILGRQFIQLILELMDSTEIILGPLVVQQCCSIKLKQIKVITVNR